VASPEVKQHLKEFVRRRKEDAAASMGNLRAAAGPAPPQPQPILRKTASESNLLKMKSKRLNSLDGGGGSRLGATPYHRQHPAIPEATAVLHTPSSSTHSSSSCNSSPNELNSPSNSVPQVSDVDGRILATFTAYTMNECTVASVPNVSYPIYD
jgi:hypothetical protein